MARPIEEGASWFPHDFDMHLDRRVRALRAKHGLVGYAVYVMTLEVLTDSRRFEVADTDEELAMLAADFDVEPATLVAIIDTCASLGLLQREDGYLRCKRLAERLEPVMEGRARARERMKVIRRKPNSSPNNANCSPNVRRSSGVVRGKFGCSSEERRGEVLNTSPLSPSSGEDGGSLTAAVSPTPDHVRQQIIEHAAANGSRFAADVLARKTPPQEKAEDPDPLEVPKW